MLKLHSICADAFPTVIMGKDLRTGDPDTEIHGGGLIQDLQVLTVPLPNAVIYRGGLPVFWSLLIDLKAVDIAIGIGEDGWVKAVYQCVTDHFLLVAGVEPVQLPLKPDFGPVQCMANKRSVSAG